MELIRNLKSSSLVTGAGVYIFASIINAAIPFLLLPVLTRYLDPAEYGEVAVYQVWVSLIGAVCGLSIQGAASRKYYDYEEPDKKIGEFIAACLMLLVSSTLLAFVLILPFSGWISETLGLAKSWLLIGVPFAFFNFIIQLRLGQWQVRKLPKRFGVFQISLSLLNMALSLALVVVLTLGVVGRLSGYTASVFIFGMLAAFLLWHDGLIKWCWRPKLIKEAAQSLFQTHRVIAEAS